MQKISSQTHIQRGQPKGSSRNITFPNIILLHYSSFTYQVSRLTFFSSTITNNGEVVNYTSTELY